MRSVVYIFSLAYPPFTGGAEIFVRELCQRLCGVFEFHVFTSRFDGALPCREEKDGAVIHRVGLGNARIDKFLYPFLAFLSAFRFSRSRPPSFLHGIMASYGGLATLFYSLLKKTPFLLTEQSGNLHDDVRKSPITFLLYRMINERAAAIHAISKSIHNAILTNVPNAAPITVIPNGVNTETFRRTVERSKHPDILCVSRLSWEKGVDDVLKAFSLVRKALPEARLSLVGDGPERENLVALSKQLGVQSAVRFFGTVPQTAVPSFLHGASVFVCASHYEGLGNVFIEAHAAGVPVVGTDVGGIPDIIEDDVTGLLVPAREPEKLAQAILDLLRHPQKADAFAEEALRRIDRFSWQRVLRDVSKLYEKIQKDRSPLRLVIATGIFPPEAGGPATYAPRLATELLRRSIHVRVVTYGEAKEATQDYSVQRVSRRGSVFFRYLSYFHTLYRAVRRADAIFSQDPISCGLPSVLVHFLTGKPYFVKIVGDAAWEYAQNQGTTTLSIDAFQQRRRPGIAMVLHMLQVFVCRHARGVIVPSKYLQRVVTQWGVPVTHITVMLNAVDIPPMSPKTEMKRERLSQLVSVGRLVPWKGFLELLDCVRELRNEFPELSLSIIGDGPQRGVLERRIRDYALEKSVHLLGRRSHRETVELIRKSDIFVLNTGYEGLSHVILESIAARTPVITTTSGGNAEIIVDGVNGRLVPTGSLAALTEAVLGLLRDPQKAYAFADEAVKTLPHFSWNVLSKTLEQYFVSHVSHKPPRSS